MCGEWTVWVPADLGLAALVCTAIVLRVEWTVSGGAVKNSRGVGIRRSISLGSELMKARVGCALMDIRGRRVFLGLWDLCGDGLGVGVAGLADVFAGLGGGAGGKITQTWLLPSQLSSKSATRPASLNVTGFLMGRGNSWGEAKKLLSRSTIRDILEKATLLA